MEACKACKFWNQSTKQCRRYAPHGTMPWVDDAGTVMVDIWAHTSPDDWCGDYAPGFRS